MKQYTTPKIQTVSFGVNDVITTSAANDWIDSNGTIDTSESGVDTGDSLWDAFDPTNP